MLEAHPGHFSAILLDRGMPRMDGMTLLRQIKDEDRHKHIPVIMQTARDSKEEILEGLEAGAYYYLTKPFAGPTLIAIVGSAAREADVVVYRIEDEGPGFDWKCYITFNPDRAFDTHGRGIAMSKRLSFDRLEFSGRGNVVTAMVQGETG